MNLISELHMQVIKTKEILNVYYLYWFPLYYYFIIIAIADDIIVAIVIIILPLLTPL